MPDEPKKVVGYTKPKRFAFFGKKQKPIYSDASTGSAAQGVVQEPVKPQAQQGNASVQPSQKKGTGKSKYIKNVLIKKKDLALQLKEIGLDITPYNFVRNMILRAAVISLVVGVGLAVALFALGFAKLVILVLPLAFGLYFMLFNNFMMYPAKRIRGRGKEIEADILFAARDMMVSMRSGMPLFNAMATVSVGYGAASKEFEKIIDRVQLGMPIEQAIEDVSIHSQSKTFNRLMLQASTSIKAGADVINALQEVVSEVSQERVIELRRYGQKLNALAMFYMLFGVIFPSMGIAVAAILSTFISIFPVNGTTLILGLVGMLIMQVVFLNMMGSSRPSYSV